MTFSPFQHGQRVTSIYGSAEVLVVARPVPTERLSQLLRSRVMIHGPMFLCNFPEGGQGLFFADELRAVEA